MNYKGEVIKPSQARVQIKMGNNWVDFATIKDADDCRNAELLVDGCHPVLKGMYRVLINKIWNEKGVGK